MIEREKKQDQEAQNPPSNPDHCRTRPAIANHAIHETHWLTPLLITREEERKDSEEIEKEERESWDSESDEKKERKDTEGREREREYFNGKEREKLNKKKYFFSFGATVHSYRWLCTVA